MTEFLVVIVLTVGIGLAIRIWGFAKCALMLLLVCTAVLPRNLTNFSATRHVGIAPANAELTTYVVVLAGFLLFAIFRPRFGYGLSIWIPFVIWLIVGMNFAWPGGPTQEAGILQLLLAPAAWALGVNIAPQINRDGGRFLVRLVAVIVFIQLAVCSLQWLGITVNAMDANQEAILGGSRFNGTLGHPNDLGKVVFLLMTLLLPFGRRLGRIDTVVWRVAMAAAFVVLGMTGGRAVSAAAVCMVLLWTVLSPSPAGTKGRKAIGLGVGLSVAVFLAGMLLSRFDEDPEGGARNTLTDIAWAQISSSPWTGIGPNSYVDVVGSYNALTASGVPVHNAFLLALAEIGIFGAVGLLLPIAVGIFVVLRRFRSESVEGDSARVYLSAIPGLYLVSTTGWGVLGGYVLPLLSMTFALLYAWSARRKVQTTDRLVLQLDI